MKDKQKIIGSLVVLIAIIVFLIIGIQISKGAGNSNSKDIFVDNNEAPTKNDETIRVCIKGAINHPNVYIVNKESIVNDVIKIAGGFSEDADMDWVEKKLNLAKKLKNEDFIYIVKNGDTSNSLSNKNINSSIQEDGTVDINSASLEELQKVNGVGPSTAQKIIDYREKNNGFKTIDDLKNVDRIGEKTFEKLKDKFVVR